MPGATKLVCTTSCVDVEVTGVVDWGRLNQQNDTYLLNTKIRTVTDSTLLEVLVEDEDVTVVVDAVLAADEV
jgi:nitrogen regulatory protein PII